MSGVTTSNLTAIAFALVGAVIGYYVPIVGAIIVILVVCLIIASVLEAGFIFEVVLAPLQALGRWLAIKDDSRWLRGGPFVGLLAGSMIRWVANSLAVSGGA